MSIFNGATFEFSIAFAKGAGQTVVDGDYTDVTKYVRFVTSTQRGRSSERDYFVTGSLNLTLWNDARIFDPDNASGTYFGNLLPMRHCRLRVTYGGTTKYLFKGYVAGWDQTWDDGTTIGYVNLHADDAFKLLAKAALPESIWAYEVKQDTPTGWWRLGEASNETYAADSSGNNNFATYSQGSLWCLTSGLVSFSPDGARTNSAASGTPMMSSPLAVSGTNFTFEAYVKAPTSPAATFFDRIWYQDDLATGNANFQFNVGDNPASIKVNIVDNLGNSWIGTWNGGSQITDGNRHHVAFTKNSTTGTLYFDGAAVTLSSTSGSLSGSATSYGSTRIYPGWMTINAGFTIDELLVYNGTALSAARVLAHYNAGSLGYAGDTVDARLTRTMTAAGYSTFPTSFDTSTQTLQGCDFGGGQTKLLDYLQLLERTEGGQARLFIAADGTLAFHSRYHDTANATTAAAFSDATGTTLPYLTTGLFEDNSTRLANDVTIQRNNGVAQRVSDSTSQTNYGVNSFSLTGLLSQLDAEMLDRANAQLYRYKDPRTRLPSFKIDPVNSTQASTLAPIARDSDIGTRVSVRKLPQNQGSAWTRNLTIEGINHTIDVNGTWEIEYLTVPYDPADQWFVLDSATQGLLDTNRLGF